MSGSAQLTMMLVGLGAYLLGSVPFGLLIGKVRGVDVREVGSRNIGATNVGRAVGRTWGLLAFALDVLKGLLPTVSAGVISSAGSPADSEAGRYLYVLGVGLLAILGHNYPLYLAFRGGKGVATTFGVALGVYPELTVSALAALLVWTVVTWRTRYVSLGSISAAVAFPLALLLLFGHRDGFYADTWPLLLSSTLLTILIVVRHRGNILRLLDGNEPKIGSR